MIPRKYINAINDEIDKLGGYFTQRDVEDIKRRAVMGDEISDELDDALQEYIEDQMEEPMEENFQNTSKMVSYKSKFQEGSVDNLIKKLEACHGEVHNFISSMEEKDSGRLIGGEASDLREKVRELKNSLEYLNKNYL